ncbi:co-chaperone GroES [Candidatus Cerribacteria bacterium 'Amazon FNV 2010 28 9']|uniref:Co-chaperonin GroES n=1 Tax=Candidatus Cerribacteria bacterium 'Amazon FNV 2010 28 9' TaxID=2081795 RepID=A0A317JP77_9BACT|nr:MAG: co-chaperone GroES [Candidatus Cerribacteria bacterium 'Amazon FNV 2010 28 9']
MNLSISQVKPMPGYVLVEPAKAQTKTDSGIFLPDSHDEKAQHGTIIAVGADTIDEKGNAVTSPVKKGQVVVYKKWGGNEFKVGDIEYQFFKFEDVLAVIDR